MSFCQPSLLLCRVLAQLVTTLLIIFPPRQLIWIGSFTEAACIVCGLLLVYGGVTGEHVPRHGSDPLRLRLRLRATP
jgi:hypothetical protein